MGYYFIKPKLNSSMCLAVANSTITGGQNVVVNAKTANYNITQKWFIESLSSNQFVLNASNQAYGLRMAALEGNTRNCVIQLSGFLGSDCVDFVSSGDGYYYIKMHTTNWYLCCAGSTQGSNAYWALNPGGTDAQKWSLESTTISGPSNYTYMVAPYSGCTLNIIRTSSQNIQIKNVGLKTLEGANAIGINGCFFDPGTTNILNIAKNDGVYVGSAAAPKNGQLNSCGSGVVYRTKTGAMYFAEGGSVDESSLAAVKNLTGTPSWAQGGAGIYPGYSGWYSKNSDFFADKNYNTQRSAMIVDTQTDYVYLIVTMNTVTYNVFRTAMMSFLNLTDGDSASTRFRGVFLDGGHSSQLRARDPNNSSVFLHHTSPNPIPEAVTLRNVT